MNKLATKVELRFDAEASAALSEPVRRRLLRLAARRLDARGRIVVTCDVTRSQAQNLTLAREKLAALVRAALVAPKRRRATKPSGGAKRARLDEKRRASEKKQSRRRVDLES